MSYTNNNNNNNNNSYYFPQFVCDQTPSFFNVPPPTLSLTSPPPPLTTATLIKPPSFNPSTSVTNAPIIHPPSAYPIVLPLKPPPPFPLLNQGVPNCTFLSSFPNSNCRNITSYPTSSHSPCDSLPHITLPPPISTPPPSKILHESACNTQNLYSTTPICENGKTVDEVPVQAHFNNDNSSCLGVNFSTNKLNEWLGSIVFKSCQETKPKTNVSKVKEMLRKYYLLIKELERLVMYLKVGVNSLSQNDWENKCTQVEDKRNELNSIYSVFNEHGYMPFVEALVRKNKKKRVQRTLKKLRWYEKKKEMIAFRVEEHKRIDNWLEKMKSEVERAQREENVKKEADLVLSDVTLKKTEAKRMITLLNTLSKLRNARAQQKTSAGKYVSEEETKTFNEVIGKLRTLWVDQLKEYNKEEHGLRVMLNDAEVERKNTEIAEFKKTLQQWNECFFGKKSDKLPDFLCVKNLEELINLRSSWDQFLSTNKAFLASSIPVGWVTPSPPCSLEWEKYLCK